MNVTIKKGTACGRIVAPPSKSMAHRYLILAAFCGDNCTVSGVDFSKDIKATLNGLESLGARFSVDGYKVIAQKAVGGVDNALVDCIESGSTLRFLIPIAAALGIKTKFVGAKRLFERPLTVYEEVFKKSKVSFSCNENGAEVSGRLNSDCFSVRGDISSQFITGLIFAQLLTNGGEIKLTTCLESAPYVELTRQAVSAFGGFVEKNDNGFIVENRRLSSHDIVVEGDYSNAAFFFALNSLGGSVTVEGLETDSQQGDAVCKKYLKKIEKGHCTLDITDCPDLAPVLFAVAAAKDGAKFFGTARLRIKESDRGAAMSEELKKFGVKTIIDDNEIEIFGNAKSPTSPLFCHNDHRIAMALSVLCTLFGGTIFGAECVEKSFGGFFKALQKLGIEVKTDET